jgi:hypothetical protein
MNIEEKQYQIQFIIDLLELKNHNIKLQTLSIQEGVIAQNKTFYLLLDSLIAHLMDKYQIPYKDVQNKFYEKFKNN